MPRCHLIKGKMTPGPPDQCWVSPYQHSRKAGHPRLEKDQIHGLFGKRSSVQTLQSPVRTTGMRTQGPGHSRSYHRPWPPEDAQRKTTVFSLKRRNQQNADRGSGAERGTPRLSPAPHRGGALTGRWAKEADFPKQRCCPYTIASY